MQRFIVLILGLVMAAATAQAQQGVGVDCGEGGSECGRTKYGLDGMNLSPLNADLSKFTDAAGSIDQFELDASFFGPNVGGSSYFVGGTGANTFGADCGARRNYHTLTGQVLLDERLDCEPTSEGPNGTCSEDGVTVCTSDDDCTGTCDLLPRGQDGGCRVSIVLSDGGKGSIDAVGTTGTCQDEGGPCTSDADCRTVNPLDICQWDLENTSQLLIASVNVGNAAGNDYVLSAATENTLGGGSIQDFHDETCDPTIIRDQPTSGTRYLLPASHKDFAELNADGEAPTYLIFDSTEGTRWRIHTDDTRVCCTSTPLPICSGFLPGGLQYPAILSRNCSDGQIFQEPNETNNWIFDDGRGSAFYTDLDYVATGQQVGRCLAHDSIACDTDPADGDECLATYCEASFQDISAFPCTSSEDCAIYADLGLSTACVQSDGDPDTEGVQPDTCDLRDIGHRIYPRAFTETGDPNGTTCANMSAYVFRGTPDVGCSINPRYTADGDPGETCEILNYGIHARKDQDCDGQIDNPVDFCPLLSEFDETRDSNGDCPGPLCRGDECTCGDATLDGRLNIEDILQQNGSIFEIVPTRNKCDATGDAACNINDILSVNTDIFTAGNSSTCRQVLLLSCGNQALDPGEGCDDANKQNLDGCNSACQVETGYACTDPSGLCADGTTACAGPADCIGIGTGEDEGVCTISTVGECTPL